MLKRIKELLARRGKKTATDLAPSAVATPPSSETPPVPQAVHRGPSVVHQPIPASELDPDAVKIVQRLARFDHAAYLVGGCVRDLLLDRRPKDFDVGTSATPRQIKRLFRNCRIIGRRFRLAHVYFQNGKIIEVATFRAQDGDDPVDTSQADLLIREDNQFGTLEEDALRRDFTVNSLFYDVANGNVLDHADGLTDLKRRLIRTIGDPTIRFREDPIRILRAVRFAARLDFAIEPVTLEALRRTRQEIPRAAAPRILEEINRFCRAGCARRSFERLRETEVFEVILPEIATRLGSDTRRWELLFSILEGLDARSAGEQTPLLGTILAALVLAAVSDRAGWRADGPPALRPNGDTLAMVDEVLRPLALRLRVSRRDQEHCRQVLEALLRMVPAVDPRRGGRRGVARHPALPDARMILASVGRTWGGSYAEASAAWDDVREAPAGVAPLEARASGSESEAGTGRRRRRGRRGGRGRRPSSTDAPRAESRPAVAPAVERESTRRDLPPVWDDDYFFAALPSVPELAADDGRPNRYGEGQVATQPGTIEPVAAESVGEPESFESEAESAATEPAPIDGEPRRRRRRRRRRRGGGGSPATPEPAGGGTPSEA